MMYLYINVANVCACVCVITIRCVKIEIKKYSTALKNSYSKAGPPSSNPSSVTYCVTLRKLLKTFSGSVSPSQKWNG